MYSVRGDAARRSRAGRPARGRHHRLRAGTAAFITGSHCSSPSSSTHSRCLTSISPSRTFTVCSPPRETRWSSSVSCTPSGVRAAKLALGVHELLAEGTPLPTRDDPGLGRLDHASTLDPARGEGRGRPFTERRGPRARACRRHGAGRPRAGHPPTGWCRSDAPPATVARRRRSARATLRPASDTSLSPTLPLPHPLTNHVRRCVALELHHIGERLVRDDPRVAPMSDGRNVASSTTEQPPRRSDAARSIRAAYVWLVTSAA